MKTRTILPRTHNLAGVRFWDKDLTARIKLAKVFPSAKFGRIRASR